MPDWAIKLFHQVVSAKRAWQFLIGVVLMTWVWLGAMTLAESRGVSREFAAPFIVLFSLCLGIVIVEICLLLKKFSINSYEYFLARMEASRKTKEIIENVQLALPQLPKDQLFVLLALKEGERKLDANKGGVFWLEKAGYIERRVQLEFDSYIYRINPNVKIELERFMRSKEEQERPEKTR